ncbi:MAG: hypothetical protein ACRDLF_15060 [Solirubrobacteraceae bacterium]
MLAYLLWHRPADGIEREAYERACAHFHRSLRHTPPAGFRGSTVFRAGELPWLAGDTYEDWYFLDDFAALGVLNEAAVAHGHRGAHDDVARRFGAGAGGLYGLLEGHADLAGAPLAVWVARPPGVARPPLGELLGDGMDPRHASLWRRALVFGPAPEYCLLTREPPGGVAPTRLPEGWRALTCARELLWPSG